MADDVDLRVDQRLTDLDTKFHSAGGKVESLSAQIEILRRAVGKAEGLASGHLTTAVMVIRSLPSPHTIPILTPNRNLPMR